MHLILTLFLLVPSEGGELAEALARIQKGGDPALPLRHDAKIPPGHDAPAPQVGSLLPAEHDPNPAGATLPDQPGGAESTAPPASSTRRPNLDATAVCQCRGYNEAVCFCLKAGLKCHCSKDIGSVWRVENGKAVAKTGRKANPNQAAFDAEWERRVKAGQDAQERPETPVATQDEPEAVVTLYSPKSWHCAHCPGFVAQDWSQMPFRVRHVEQDGLGSYPQARWTDKSGVTRILTGKHSPWQVEWSWRRTQ